MFVFTNAFFFLDGGTFWLCLTIASYFAYHKKDADIFRTYTVTCLLPLLPKYNLPFPCNMQFIKGWIFATCSTCLLVLLLLLITHFHHHNYMYPGWNCCVQVIPHLIQYNMKPSTVHHFGLSKLPFMWEMLELLRVHSMYEASLDERKVVISTADIK
jgi:hypothetical protein